MQIEIDEAIKAIFAKWRRHGHMQLHVGEMKAQEKRSVVAVLNAVEREVLERMAEEREKPSGEHWV